MKQAILITAYKNFDHLIDVVGFFNENFEIYIHIDKKSIVTQELFDHLYLLPQVKLISRKYKVNWGGIHHLKCILYLAEEALKTTGIQRFHVISGHDYPVKSCEYFVDFFANHPTDNYLDYHELPSPKWPNGGLDRIEYYNFYDILDAKKYRLYIFKLVRWQKKLRVKRAISKKAPKLYGGETWWSLSRDAVKYLLEYTSSKPYLINRLRHSFCSEEIYVHTVLLNSPIADTVVNDSLRFIDWSDRNGNFPANLDITDFKAILDSNKLFARKFEFPISEQLKFNIMEHLKQN